MFLKWSRLLGGKPATSQVPWGKSFLFRTTRRLGTVFWCVILARSAWSKDKCTMPCFRLILLSCILVPLTMSACRGLILLAPRSSWYHHDTHKFLPFFPKINKHSRSKLIGWRSFCLKPLMLFQRKSLWTPTDKRETRSGGRLLSDQRVLGGCGYGGASHP